MSNLTRPEIRKEGVFVGFVVIIDRLFSLVGIGTGYPFLRTSSSRDEGLEVSLGRVAHFWLRCYVRLVWREKPYHRRSGSKPRSSKEASFSCERAESQEVFTVFRKVVRKKST